MAKKNRVDLNAVIQANLPDNNTDFITPALDREVEIDEVDSCFNLEDDTAFDVNYTPTTPADWGGTLPTEVGDGLDILIKKVSTNPSQSIAYVATNGSDVVNEYEIGNPLKPFATIQAAIDALPNNNSTVYVLGGTYTETTGSAYLINMEIKNNINIILKGVTINGSIRLANCNNCFVDLSGSVVNSNLTYGLIVVTSSNCAINLEAGVINNGRVDIGFSNSVDIKLTGGKIIQGITDFALNIGDGSIVDSVYIETAYPNGGAIQGNADLSVLKKPFITNCRILNTTGYAGYRLGDAIFDTCSIKGLAGVSSNPNKLIDFINCRIEATGASQYTTAGEGVTRGKFNNCTLIAVFNNVRVFSASQDLNFENCTFIAGKDCIEVSSTIIRSGDDTILQNCSFFPAQTNVLGVVLNDASGYGSDTGVFRFIRNTYSKVWSTTDALRAIDYNSTTIVGLLPPPIV